MLRATATPDPDGAAGENLEIGQSADPGTAGGQSFFRDRAIAPMAGANVSHSPIVTTMDVM